MQLVLEIIVAIIEQLLPEVGGRRREHRETENEKDHKAAIRK